MALTTVAKIKLNTTIGGNVDPDKINPIIDEVEYFVLIPKLGQALYDKLVNDGGSDPDNNLSGDYLTLYQDYVDRLLWYSVYANYLHDAITVAQNGGVYTHVTDDGIQASSDDIKRKAKRYESLADSVIDRMDKFLCDSNISEYDDSQPNNYDVHPQDVETSSGIYLGEDIDSEFRKYFSE